MITTINEFKSIFEKHLMINEDILHYFKDIPNVDDIVSEIKFERNNEICKITFNSGKSIVLVGDFRKNK